MTRHWSHSLLSNIPAVKTGHCSVRAVACQSVKESLFSLSKSRGIFSYGNGRNQTHPNATCRWHITRPRPDGDDTFLITDSRTGTSHTGSAYTAPFPPGAGQASCRSPVPGPQAAGIPRRIPDPALGPCTRSSAASTGKSSFPAAAGQAPWGWALGSVSRAVRRTKAGSRPSIWPRTL